MPHCPPFSVSQFHEKAAYWAIQSVRWCFDTVTGYRYECGWRSDPGSVNAKVLPSCSRAVECHIPPMKQTNHVFLPLSKPRFHDLCSHDKPQTEAQWLRRIIFLETVAGVPGMCGGKCNHCNQCNQSNQCNQCNSVKPLSSIGVMLRCLPSHFPFLPSATHCA